MRFAYVNSNLVESEPGLQGLCPGCGQPVIARCGTERISHWAHRQAKRCDSWWEPETEWHRTWKSNYPLAWQEKFLPDPNTGEKHMADIYASDGLIIEFQHSHIKPEERVARERFYRTMVWVVDGTRLERDYPRFLKGKSAFKKKSKPRVFISEFPDECFPSAWLKSSVPVIFDFKGIQFGEQPENELDNLYCLFPNKDILDSLVVELPRRAFINMTNAGEWLSRIGRFMDELAEEEEKHKKQVAEQQRRQANLIFQSMITHERRRRF
ncbi:competence protein CoiA [Chitinophaga sp. S165]|uniref:competence protein CoiA n=1 Tax=Chitinophaga sp. S165 TaxID=2135462 RepID=UPI000D713A08|nr:competence protein CoiA family protein [Chitinophaga sp. S165]PWV55568.1 competence protein CoiA-like protein [Chitinophaga sp. S165]